MAYPPLPICVNPVYKMQIFGELYGQTTITNLYYMDVNAANPVASTASLEQMVVDIWGSIDTAFLACLGPQWSVTRIVMESMNNRVQRPAIANFTPGAVVGTNAGEADTAWVAGKLSRITDTRGLRGQGCVRLSGIPLTEIEGNNMSAALKTLFNALGTALAINVTSTTDPGFTVTSALVNEQSTRVPPVRAQVVAEWEAVSRLSSQKTRRSRTVT